jgi:hypothetical protein
MPGANEWNDKVIAEFRANGSGSPRAGSTACAHRRERDGSSPGPLFPTPRGLWISWMPPSPAGATMQGRRQMTVTSLWRIVYARARQ